MASTNRILLGKGERPVYLHAQYGTRHGLVAGATGTGKTVSLMVIAEGFSRMGVPVFIPDVKGDVAGLALAATEDEKIRERVARIGIDGYVPEPNPVVFWDFYGKSGHLVRTTVSEIGPSLLGRILDLSDPQLGAIEIAFKLADDRGLLLLDLDDLRALLTFVAENRKEISSSYGLVSVQSIAAIQRGLLSLEREGADALFGEPALELTDLLRTDLSGRGIINVLAADQLISNPPALFQLSAVAPVRALRELAGSWRSRQAEILNRKAGAIGARGATGAEGATGAPAEADAPGLPRRSGEAAEAGSKVNDFLWGTKRRQGMVETMAKQAARPVGSKIGRQILRDVLGGILGGRRVR